MCVCVGEHVTTIDAENGIVGTLTSGVCYTFKGADLADKITSTKVCVCYLSVAKLLKYNQINSAFHVVTKVLTCVCCLE